MKARILGLLAAALLAGPTAASAGFVLPVIDTSTEFSGTFSLQGCDNEDRVLSSFGLLPGVEELNEQIPYPDGLFIKRKCQGEGSISLLLATDALGKDGSKPNPIFEFPDPELSLPFSRVERSGDYGNPANLKIDEQVYWRFTELADTGGLGGTFSGAFCFSTSPNGCTSTPAPEPGTFALLGLGLAGLAASRRRKR